ncbi:MAG TPA: dienelactone hydrolase family protein [Blastocatellia bacterium]|jgi:predicted esterase|nr:dienelactone hydrolase family protein [Blastocatellia bacterium]
MISKNLGWALLALPMLLFQARAAERITKETLESQGKKRTYYLMIPDSAKSPASVPLIVLLHGSGRNGLSLMEKWKELASREGIIIAGPDSRDTQGWQIPGDGPGFIHDLVEELRAKYPINPRRIYLFGHSAGAVFALNLSMMESEYFAATAVHAGSWRTERELSARDYAKRKTPLAIIVGDRDAFFPLPSVKATEAALKERGFAIEVKVMKGHDHWYYDLAPQINRDAWDFLKARELNEDPRYEAYDHTLEPKGANEAMDVNAAAGEINSLREKANESTLRFYAKEAELSGKDFVKEKAAVAAIAREQIEALKAGASALRDAALKADHLSNLKLGGGYPQYYTLAAQMELKRAEILEAMRERAELLLSDEPTDTITLKRNEMVVRVEKLKKEAEELEQKAERIRSGQNR